MSVRLTRPSPEVMAAKVQQYHRVIKEALSNSLGKTQDYDFHEVRNDPRSAFIYATVLDVDGYPAVTARAHLTTRRWDTYYTYGSWRILTVEQAANILDCVTPVENFEEDYQPVIERPLRFSGYEKTSLKVEEK